MKQPNKLIQKIMYN